MPRSPLFALIALALVGAAPPPMAALAQTAPATARPDFSAADRAVEEAIAAGQIPGAVLLVGRGDEVLHRKAYGRRAVAPRAEAMTVDTIFDTASLSKAVGMATSVLILADRGQISLADPVAKYLPAFAANGKENVTIEQLLLHHGGLPAGNAMSEYADGRDKSIERIMAVPLKGEPGQTYIYTDLGPIVLGELVAAVDGRSLDNFAREEVFARLRMNRTAYNPRPAWRGQIAPTATRNGQPMRGEVHDPRAYALGGVAGHAGVFSTADDLARWCQMLLRGGELDGRRVLKPETVEAMMTKRCLPNGTGCRGYGLDVMGERSTLRGGRFPVDTTVGHTGYTGTSLVIDPTSDVYVILLTNRVHPDGKGDATPVRRAVSKAVTEALGTGGE